MHIVTFFQGAANIPPKREQSRLKSAIYCFIADFNFYWPLILWSGLHVALLFLFTMRESRYKDTVNHQQQEPNAAEQVQVMEPGGRGIGTAEDAVHHYSHEAGITNIMEQAPIFSFNAFT